MEFSTKAVDWNKSEQILASAPKVDCWVVGVFAGQTLSGLAKVLDAASQGVIARLIKAGDFTGKRGSTLCLHHLSGVTSARVLLVGLGKAADYDLRASAEVQRAASKALLTTQASSALWCLGEQPVLAQSVAATVLHTVQHLRDQAYDFIANFPALKAKPSTSPRRLKKIVLLIGSKEEKAAKTAVAQGIALANGMDLTKNLANLPANFCTPTYLAETAKRLAKTHKLKVEVLGRKQIEALKMGSFLAVTQGTEQAPQFIVLKYQGAEAKKAPVVLVGKGITFDSGGISLKPGEGMDEMKYDMCGAATVLGTLQAAAEMGLKQNIVAVIPSCENMPSGCAVKPGDVVTSMSGQTIEILNTDAEGRLILCDALTYVERFKPAAVIDIATLTGACVIALGHVHSGLFSTDDKLAAELEQAGKQSLDTAWRMPVEAPSQAGSYQEQLKSNFADIANIGGRPAGSVTAACFLARFTEKYHWAHLDIAGTAWKSGAAKGATARPVPLLTHYLMARS